MNRECILEQAKQHDSFYLYEEAIIRKKSIPESKEKVLKPCGFRTFVAAGEGFEPSHTESESAVLPLHKPAIFARSCRTNRYYYT